MPVFLIVFTHIFVFCANLLEIAMIRYFERKIVLLQTNRLKSAVYGTINDRLW